MISEKTITRADCSPSVTVTSLTTVSSPATRRWTSKLQRPVFVAYRAWTAAKSSLPTIRSPEHGQSTTHPGAKKLAARVQSSAFIADQNAPLPSRPDSHRRYRQPDHTHA